MECSFFLIFFLLASSDLLTANSLRVRDLIVKRGYKALLKTEYLRIVPSDSIVCRVEIIPDPTCLRFGSITSERFHCDLNGSKQVSYIHSGSAISDDDCIKLKLLRFFEDKTEIKIIKVKVVVQNRPKEEKLSGGVVIVNRIGGRASFGKDILPSFIQKHTGMCSIEFSVINKYWPANGKVVVKASQGEEALNCRSFNATYIHDGSYIPNIDYIPFLLTWRNKTGHFMHMRYQMKVRTKGAQKNDPPVLHSRRPRLIVKQYSITQIKVMTLRAIDYRTHPSKLLLKISGPRHHHSYGYFSTVDDPSTPLEGFTQEMIDKGVPLFVAPKDYETKIRRSFIIQQFQIEALDQYGAISKTKLRIVFFVKKFIPHYLSVVKNNPLHVLEGKSCNLGTETMDILCPASKCSRAKFSVVGEPKHGSLLINSKKINEFTYQDLKRGNIIYKHDDSESIVDNVIVSLMEKSQLAFATLNVIVEPIDDSPPFLSVHKDISVRSGQMTQIDEKFLKATDPDSSTNDIKFRIVVMPKRGSIKRNDNGSFVSVGEFSEVDLEQGLIYYKAFAKELTNDTFDFILSDRTPNLSKKYTVKIKIIATDVRPPRKRYGGECIARMNETDASLAMSLIDYIDNVSPSSDISIKLLLHKKEEYRYARSTDIVRKIGHNYVPTTTFTQQELFHSRILYLNSEGEVGMHAKNLRFDFVVSDRANNTTPTQSCTIIIHPVDNKAPEISLFGKIRVPEGGKVCMNRSDIEVTDVDTALTRVKLRLKSTPRHGRVIFKGRNISESETIDYVELRNLCLWYYHDDSETKRDAFVLSATDGVNSRQHRVVIEIEPVNDLRPHFVEKSNKIHVVENSSVVIGPDIFKAVDEDSEKSAFRFYLLKMPKLGYLKTTKINVKEFTQGDVDNDLLAYKHKEIEIGPYVVEDNFTVLICDLPLLANACISVVHIQVVISPINSSPPLLIPGEELVVKEGGSTVVGSSELSCNDKDTLLEKINIQVLKFPEFGYLENVAPSAGSEQSNAGLQISTFLCSDLDRRSINYVQYNHIGFEPLLDSFEVVACDGVFNSTTVIIRVKIRPVSDERPTIAQIAPIAVQEGGWVLINKNHISIEDQDIPKDVLKFYIANKPKHGQMFYKCNGVPFPRLQRLNINTPLDYIRCVLIYVHDDSETLFDNLKIEATDGKMVSSTVARVKVIPVNDMKPQIVKNIAMTVRFGGFKNITRSYLVTQDVDTQASQLKYRITKLASYGSLKLSRGGMPVRMQLNGTFTQDDIDKKRLSYVNHIMPVSGLADTIQFTLSDGVHSIKNQTFAVRIRLSCRKYFSLKTKNVHSNSAKIYITSSHLRAERRKAVRKGMAKNVMFHIVRQPKHGIISLDTSEKARKVTTLKEADLKGRRLFYRSFEFPRKNNDSFRFFATDGKCMQRGKIYIFTVSKNTAFKVMKRVSPLSVMEKGATSITSLEIRAFDRFESRKVIYHIKHLPKHGMILKDGANVSTFSQQDVNELRISYLLLDIKAKEDETLIAVFVKNFFGSNLDSKLDTFPLKISINIPNVGTANVITNEAITALESLRRGTIGAVISKQSLLSYDCTSRPDFNLTYMVTNPPVHGEVIFKDSRHQATIFTQGDINLERVIYRLTDHTNTDFSDSFTLSIESTNCQKLLGVEFSIQWSILSISEKIKVECADGRTNIVVKLTRNGYIDQGAVVEVHTKSASDNIETLLPSRIWFQPGDKEKTWQMPEEALEYEKVEIYLSNTFNTLLGTSNIIFDIAKAEDACSSERMRNQKNFTSVNVDNLSNSQSMKNQQFHAIQPVKTNTDFKPNGQAAAKLEPMKGKRKFAACNTGWIGFQENCYFLSSKTASWRKGKKLCKRKNANLYAPSSTLEDVLVKKIGKGKAIWIGIKVGKKKNWKWNIKKMRQPFLRRLQRLENQKLSKNLCVYIEKSGEWKLHNCKEKAVAFYICKKLRKYKL